MRRIIWRNKYENIQKFYYLYRLIIGVTFATLMFVLLFCNIKSNVSSAMNVNQIEIGVINENGGVKIENDLRLVLSQIFKPSSDFMELYSSYLEMNSVITASQWNAINSFQIQINNLYSEYFTENGFNNFCYSNIYLAYFDALENGNNIEIVKIEVKQDIYRGENYNFIIHLINNRTSEMKKEFEINGKAKMDKKQGKILLLDFDSEKDIFELSLSRLISD